MSSIQHVHVGLKIHPIKSLCVDTSFFIHLKLYASSSSNSRSVARNLSIEAVMRYSLFTSTGASLPDFKSLMSGWITS